MSVYVCTGMYLWVSGLIRRLLGWLFSRVQLSPFHAEEVVLERTATTDW